MHVYTSAARSPPWQVVSLSLCSHGDRLFHIRNAGWVWGVAEAGIWAHLPVVRLGPSWAWWWAKLFLMDLHKTICISAPAHWKAIDKMIMTTGPRNCCKMCNHFVCCISRPLFPSIYLYSMGPVQQDYFPPLVSAWFPFRFEVVSLTYHSSALQDALY